MHVVPSLHVITLSGPGYRIHTDSLTPVLTKVNPRDETRRYPHSPPATSSSRTHPAAGATGRYRRSVSPDMCVVRGLWRRRYRVPSMSGRLTSGGTIGEENLRDASGLFQSGEVSGVGEGDRFGAGKQGEVGFTFWLARPVVIAVDQGHRS